MTQRSSGVSGWLEQRLPALIIILHVLLALGFSLTPIFEAYSEQRHYDMVQVLIRLRGLPNMAEMPVEAVQQTQYHQPPLAYLVAMPIELLSPGNDFASIQTRLNPFRYPLSFGFNVPDNNTYYVHSRAERLPFPTSPTARSVFLMRLTSIGLSAATLLAAASAFRRLWPDDPGRYLLALTIMAFWPQSIYLNSLYGNDSLLILCVTLATTILLRAIDDGFTLGGALILGVVLGAGLLTKSNMAIMAIPVGVVFLTDRRAWRYLPVTFAVVCAIAAWWYIRNLILYQDATAFLYMITLSGWTFAPDGSPVWAGVPARLFTVPRTIWAIFGDNAILPDTWVYLPFYTLLLTAGIGLAMALWQRIRGRAAWPSHAVRRQIVFLGTSGLCWAGAVVYLSAVFIYGHEGRYLLPGLVVWSATLAAGVGSLIPPAQRLTVAFVIAATLLTASLACLLGYVLPAYRLDAPPVQINHPLDLEYAGVARITGIDQPIVRARPGDIVSITLYWEALGPAQAELLTYLHTESSPLIRRDSYPGLGKLLATEWEPGMVWAEKYLVAIPEDTDEQVMYPLIAGLTERDTGKRLVARAGGISDVVPRVGRLAIAGPPASLPDLIYSLGPAIRMGKASIEMGPETVTVCLPWATVHPLIEDYQVFFHLRESGSGTILTQADRQPRNGLYPTGAWSPGEVITDCVVLIVPPTPSLWEIGVGMYTLGDLRRLPMTDAGGQPVPDDIAIIYRSDNAHE